MLLKYLDISQFRGLNELKIGDCSNLVDIEIVSLTLRSFHYCGNMIGIRVLNAYQLKDVLFNISPRRRYRPFPLAGIFSCGIIHVTVLTTTAAFLELFMEGSTFCNVYDIACVLKNCPNIERFFIDLSEFSFESGHYWEAHHKHLFEQYNEPMTKLRVIKIKGFKHQGHEIELVKFLLKSATSLETLILVTAKGYRATAQDLELVGFDSYLHI
ncbi:hypothetical protein Q3G72_018330 [Acer saccharum]|nr:hypothetical protein Q3G72_018330 [Acer saccharum]